jgi:glycosidase
MRVLDNHDFDRFYHKPPSTVEALKQAMTILLTVPGIPQFYYGTEIVMSGTKSPNDGNVRRDFPGGWSDDPVSCFAAEGRSELQNEAWSFIAKLLHWRKGNEVIANGAMKMFKPYHGVFVYERRLGDSNVVIVLSGVTTPRSLPVPRYQEVFRGRTEWRDVVTDRVVTLGKHLALERRDVLVLI